MGNKSFAGGNSRVSGVLGSLLLAIVVALSAGPIVSAQTWANAPCSIINGIGYAVQRIVPSLVAIMFTYGGIKYASSADDPGGRKAGKSICIQAIIGAILYGLASTMYTAIFTGATHLSAC